MHISQSQGLTQRLLLELSLAHYRAIHLVHIFLHIVRIILGHWMIARKPALGVGDRTLTQAGHVFPDT